MTANPLGESQQSVDLQLHDVSPAMQKKIREMLDKAE
jgi:hypothetical protein